MKSHINQLLVQAASPLGTIGNGEGFGPFGTANVTGNSTSAIMAITKVISVIIGFITISGGIYFIFQLLISGFEWLMASGDKSRLTKAQDRMTHSIIGLIVIVATYSIVSIVAGILGFENLLLKDPTGLIQQLQLK